MDNDEGDFTGNCGKYKYHGQRAQSYQVRQRRANPTYDPRPPNDTYHPKHHTILNKALDFTLGVNVVTSKELKEMKEAHEWTEIQLANMTNQCHILRKINYGFHCDLNAMNSVNEKHQQSLAQKQQLLQENKLRLNQYKEMEKRKYDEHQKRIQTLRQIISDTKMKRNMQSIEILSLKRQNAMLTARINAPAEIASLDMDVRKILIVSAQIGDYIQMQQRTINMDEERINKTFKKGYGFDIIQNNRPGVTRSDMGQLSMQVNNTLRQDTSYDGLIAIIGAYGTERDIIVSGNRGLQNDEYFGIDELAESFGSIGGNFIGKPRILLIQLSNPGNDAVRSRQVAQLPNRKETNDVLVMKSMLSVGEDGLFIKSICDTFGEMKQSGRFKLDDAMTVIRRKLINMSQGSQNASVIKNTLTRSIIIDPN